MLAIVLSCDRYSVFRNHMIMQYAALWKTHPFRFRIPFQKERDSEPLVGIAHEFIKTPLDIKQCVLALLSNIDDEEWIFWCIDDKYPVVIDADIFQQCHNWVLRLEDPSVAGVTLCRPDSLTRPSLMNYEDVIQAPWGEQLIGRRHYKKIWLHQFVRVKVIRTLFQGFPDGPFKPKEMDVFHRRAQRPTDHRLFVARSSHAVFGESTTRGQATKNCADSLLQWGFELPQGMTTSGKSKLLGKSEKPFRNMFRRAHEYLHLSGIMPSNLK
jgi:hypothetical protein